MTSHSKLPQHDVIVRPLINEKSTEQREKQNQYAFEVHAKASKDEVRGAVEKFFNVKVAGVRTLNNHGKLRRVGQTQGRKANWKKAIVTLKEGSSIDFFGNAT
jgi:large subunit ribosomal protein L23